MGVLSWLISDIFTLLLLDCTSRSQRGSDVVRRLAQFRDKGLHGGDPQADIEGYEGNPRAASTGASACAAEDRQAWLCPGLIRIKQTGVSRLP